MLLEHRVPSWQTSFPSAGVTEIATTQDNTIWVAGQVYSTTILGVSPPHRKYIARFSPGGSLMNAFGIGQSSSSLPGGYRLFPAAHLDGYVTVTGWYGSALTLGPGETNETTLPSHPAGGMFVARWSVANQPPVAVIEIDSDPPPVLGSNGFPVVHIPAGTSVEVDGSGSTDDHTPTSSLVFSWSTFKPLLNEV